MDFVREWQDGAITAFVVVVCLAACGAGTAFVAMLAFIPLGWIWVGPDWNELAREAMLWSSIVGAVVFGPFLVTGSLKHGKPS